MATGVEVRMSVDVGRASVGGPAGMTNTQLSSDRLLLASRGELLDAAAFLADLESFSIEDG